MAAQKCTGPAILIDAFDGIDWREGCLEWNFMVLSGVR
jgi:hypothetical protein